MGAVGFGDDPDFVARGGAVPAEEPEAAVQAVLVFVAVFFGGFAPIAGHIAGATLLSLGSTVMWTVLKNWWVWRKEYRRYRNG